MPLTLRRRLPAAAGLVLAGSAGPVFRSITEGPVANVGRGLLYAVGIYALMLLIRPATTGRTASVVTVAACWIVEFAQLTPFPSEASQHNALSRLVLGSTFQPVDLASYLIGALLAWTATAATATAATATAVTAVTAVDQPCSRPL